MVRKTEIERQIYVYGDGGDGDMWIPEDGEIETMFPA
jgi:hypothetical protein